MLMMRELFIGVNNFRAQMRGQIRSELEDYPGRKLNKSALDVQSLICIKPHYPRLLA